MISCIIIEDDILASELLKNYIDLNFRDKLKLVGIAGSMCESLELIHKKSPDLVFLDIDLPDQNGLSLFTHFPSNSFEVIFTTSSPDYAISAIKHFAIDYLIKPVNLLDLHGAIARFEKKKNSVKTANEAVKQLINNLKMGVSYEEKVALPTSDGFQVIQFNEILYCQASENYSNIYTNAGNSFLVTKTLKSIEKMLPAACFFRIHKSILLNINYVKSFSKKEGFIATLENGQKFEVATRRQEEFVNLFFRKTAIPDLENGNSPLSRETLN